MRLFSIIMFLALSAARCLAQEHAEKAVELERRVFAATDPAEKARLILEKSALFKQSGDYRQALQNLKRIDTAGLPVSLKARTLYERSLAYFLDRSYFASLSVMKDLNRMEIQKTEDMRLLEIMVCNQNGKWEDCKALLLKEAGRRRGFKDTAAIARLSTGPEFKDPVKARTLSRILPGAGQVYAGYPVKGATSLIINAGLLAFTVYNAASSYYVMAGVSGVFPLLKFYRGGAELSERLAMEENKTRSDKLKAQYAELIFRVFSFPPL